MATYVRKFYDNDKKYYTPWSEALGIQPYRKPIGKSGTDGTYMFIDLTVYSINNCINIISF